MELYDSNGYFNFRAVRDLGFPFTMVLGGRGTGKTFGALKSSIEDGRRFVFLRRRQTQLDIINKPEFSPIRPVCRVTGWRYTMRPIAHGFSGFVPYDLAEDGTEIITGPPVGFTAALSTVGNLRGFDSSGVELAIFDEAIPEKGEAPIPHEADKLHNFYETFNRNRELEGRQPMQLVCMANANDQGSPILQAWGLVGRVEKMRKKGQTLYTDPATGRCLVMLYGSPVSEAKAQTALYRLTAGTAFSEMAIANDFSYEDRSKIKPQPLGEFRPVCSVGKLTIYRHKSDPLYYVTTHRSGTPETYGTTAPELERFRHKWGHLWRQYVSGGVCFEDYESVLLFTEYLE